MRHRFTLQSALAVPDGMTGTTRYWTTVASLWGRLELLSDDETFVADRPEQACRYRLVTRWRAGAEGGQRLLLGSRSFEVRAVSDPGGDRRRLLWNVEERTP